jgi:3-isopropylmalate dehydrogenase
MEEGNAELRVTPNVVISLRRITRQCCEQIGEAACELAMKRQKHLTIVHKANALRMATACFWISFQF